MGITPYKISRGRYSRRGINVVGSKTSVALGEISVHDKVLLRHPRCKMILGGRRRLGNGVGGVRVTEIVSRLPAESQTGFRG